MYILGKLSDKECMWMCRLGCAIEVVIAGNIIGFALKYQLYPHLPIVILPLAFLVLFYIWQRRLGEKVKNGT